MDDMANYPGLVHVEGSSSWYFRKRIPRDVVAAFPGKTAVKRSLRTSDLKEAKLRYHAEALAFEKEVEAARRRLNPTPVQELDSDTIKNLAAQHLHSVLSVDEDRRISGLRPTDHESITTGIELFKDELKEALACGKTEVVEHIVDNLLEENNISLPKQSESHKRLSYAVLATTIKASNMLEQRQSGEIVETPPQPEPIPIADEEAPTNGAKGGSHTQQGQGMTLLQAFEGWRTETQRRPKTAEGFKAQLSRFVELHGDLPVAEITRAHVRDFKDALLKLPSNPGLRPQGVDIHGLIAMTEKDPSLPRLSSTTVNMRYLAALRAILGWAVVNDHCANNPAVGVKAATAHSESPARTPLSTDDLKLIFNTFPVFAQGERPKAGRGEAARWIPLLALFTGARLGELCQLYTTDIKEEDGIAFIDLREFKEPTRTIKNNASRRRIPIHPELVKLGFLDYVQSVREADKIDLFPKLKADRHGNKVTSWSEWWSKYRKRHGLTGTDKVFHSFRHTVKDALREAEVEKALADALQGHSSGDVGSRYGQGYSLRRLYEALSRMAYPSLDLSHLYPTS